MTAEPDSEIYVESDDVVQERVRRAIRADSVSLTRAQGEQDRPVVLLMLGLAENDVLYPLSLPDANWLAMELSAAAKAMGGVRDGSD